MRGIVMTEESIRELKKVFAIKWIIYLMLTTSIFFYFLITVILKKTGFAFVEDFKFIRILANLFIGFSAVALFAAFFIRRNVYNPDKFFEMIGDKKINDELVEKFTSRMKDESVKRISKLILMSNTIDVISWALCEAVAILGLVLVFLSGNTFYLQAFGGAALLSMAFLRPNFTNFLSVVEHALGRPGA